MQQHSRNLNNVKLGNNLSRALNATSPTLAARALEDKYSVSSILKLFAPVTSVYAAVYEPIHGEISSMRRLRVTKGICLPSDYPIHLVCGSKDVIHSWAIPGLGVKIDCIPGYNCHRRVLFRWRGVYWGPVYGGLWPLSPLNAYNGTHSASRHIFELMSRVFTST